MVRRSFALINEAFREAAGEALGRAIGEVGVIGAGFAGQQDVQDVVEIVVPLRIIAAIAQPCGIVAFVFEHEVDVAIGQRLADFRGHGVEKGVVRDGVDCVEAQAVDAIVAQPHQRVVDEEAMHGLFVHRDCAAPGRLDLGIEEARGILADVIPVGTEVIVNDVEEDGEAEAVRGVDQRMQIGGGAVAFVRRIGQHAVIAPTARTAEGTHGHELDGGDAGRGDGGELIDDAAETAEQAGMQLDEHRLFPWPPAPVGDGPGIGRVDDQAPAMNAARLRAGRRIGDDRVADAEAIARSGRGLRRRDEPAVVARHHIGRRGAVDLQLDASSVRRPEREAGAPVVERRRAPALGHAWSSNAPVQVRRTAPCGATS